MSISDKVAAELGEILQIIAVDQAALAAGLVEFQNGNRITGARPLQLPSDSTSGRLATGSGRLVGWSLTATDGPVQLVLRDSWTADTGDVLAGITVTAAGATTHSLAGPGVSFGEGLFLQRLAGSTGKLLGAIYLGSVD